MFLQHLIGLHGTTISLRENILCSLIHGKSLQSWNMYFPFSLFVVFCSVLIFFLMWSSNYRKVIFSLNYQVKRHGVSVFLMPSGMLGTLLSLVDVLPLFSNTAWGQNANLDFLKKHMGATFEKRIQPWRATVDPADVHSGDFLAVSKIRGRWGGFETLEKWVTGAFAGHTAVCLKDEMGNLWVGESGHENEKV